MILGIVLIICACCLAVGAFKLAPKLTPVRSDAKRIRGEERRKQLEQAKIEELSKRSFEFGYNWTQDIINDTNAAIVNIQRVLNGGDYDGNEATHWVASQNWYPNRQQPVTGGPNGAQEGDYFEWIVGNGKRIAMRCNGKGWLTEKVYEKRVADRSEVPNRKSIRSVRCLDCGATRVRSAVEACAICGAYGVAYDKAANSMQAATTAFIMAQGKDFDVWHVDDWTVTHAKICEKWVRTWEHPQNQLPPIGTGYAHPGDTFLSSSPAGPAYRALESSWVTPAEYYDRITNKAYSIQSMDAPYAMQVYTPPPPSFSKVRY